MLIHLLSAAPADVRTEVLAFLERSREQHTAADVAAVAGLLEPTAAWSSPASFGHGIAGAAEDAFEVAFGGGARRAERRFVHDLIAWMLRRAA